MTSFGQTSKSQATELCEIIRERAFDDALKIIAKNYQRMSELDNAIDWVLQRGAHCFHLVEDDYYIWKTEDILPGFPALRIVYQYNQADKVVTLVSIEEIPSLKID